MEQRSTHIARDEPMRFVMRVTSRDRFWTGLEARIYETSGGFAQSTPGPNHCLCMHLSAPIHASCRFEGTKVPRLQIAGDIDLLPPGSSASWEDDGETLMIAVAVHPPLFHAAAQGMGIDPDRVVIPPKMQLRDPQIEYIVWALKAELESEDRYGRVYAESLGVALASHLLRSYGHPTTTARIGNGLSNRRLQRVLEYVQEHLSHDLSLIELAEIANVSPSHFKVLFKKAIGTPVHQYIIRRRVEQAIRLIVDTDIPLSEIAMLAGFSNQSHMARLTRRVTGASPAELRSQAS